MTNRARLARARSRILLFALIAMAACALALATPAYAAQAAIQPSPKPAGGMTKGQPFPSGTGGSANFRIPSLVSLDDGTLVAATDARWNSLLDGGGLDTLVSRSKDMGATWRYSFANYLGDNGNEWNALSTSFIDPALATDGRAIYMLVDLFPAGISLSTSSTRWTPQPGSAFDSRGNLKLRDARLVPLDTNDDNYAKKAAAARYDYYLDLSDHTIRRESDGSKVKGYTVDAQFNITSADKSVRSNLFCADSPFMVYPTSYLYFTRSLDSGATWSGPSLLNLKDPKEQALINGPGTGLVLADGALMYNVYAREGKRLVSGLVWSTDGGKTWRRSSDIAPAAQSLSTEASTVQIAPDVVRQFVRDGSNMLHYTDYRLVGDTWTPEITCNTGVLKTSDCQLSAMRYDGRIDGRQAIVVSTAVSYTGARTDGHLYVGLLNSDGSIEWRYSYPVVPEGGDYGYSSIARLPNGSIAVLYETESGAEQFAVVPVKKLLSTRMTSPAPTYSRMGLARLSAVPPVSPEESPSLESASLSLFPSMEP